MREREREHRVEAPPDRALSGAARAESPSSSCTSSSKRQLKGRWPRTVKPSSRWCKVTHYNGDRTTKGWIKRLYTRDSDCP